MNTKNQYDFIQSDWFFILNTSIFGLANGFLATALFVLGPDQVKKVELKEAAGFIMVLGLYLGIFTGSLIALLFKDINK